MNTASGFMADGDKYMAQDIAIGHLSPSRALKCRCGCYYKLRLTTGISGLEEAPEKCSILG